MAKVKIEIKNFNIDDDIRYLLAGGDCICKVCGKTYNRHPEHERYNWLNVLCDGTLVKL